jgi:hypothetical protein
VGAPARVHGANLHLEPNEASDLCPAFDRDVLDAHGWDRAFVTVLDESAAEGAIAVLGHDRGAEPGQGWSAERVHARPTGGKGRTEDAEACARRDGTIYLFGSQFGKKAGPLSARRSWMARVHERSLADALAGGEASLEIVRLRFGLHRAVNDALVEAGVDLISLGPRAREDYIDATVAIGESKSKRWAGRVMSGDHPLNVEAAEFRRDGRALLGLRYPVTAEGHPILVELDDVDAVFAEPDAVPSCTRVWVLDDVGSEREPAGFRGLHTHGDDRFDAVVGDLDASGKDATVLEDHPQGASARSHHVRFDLPPTATGGRVTSELVHDFADVRRVEGVVVEESGDAYYVLDEEGHVALRTLVFE